MFQLLNNSTSDSPLTSHLSRSPRPYSLLSAPCPQLPAINKISQETPKFIGSEATLSRNVSHRVGIHRISARYLHRAHTIAHRNMLALPDYNKSDFLECPHSCQMIHAGQF